MCRICSAAAGARGRSSRASLPRRPKQSRNSRSAQRCAGAAPSVNSRAVKYCPDFFRYERRVTREVMVGQVGVGGNNPIRVQSMITCDTMDTEASIGQTMELAAAGCEIVRITAPTVKDARNLEQ